MIGQRSGSDSISIPAICRDATPVPCMHEKFGSDLSLSVLKLSICRNLSQCVTGVVCKYFGRLFSRRLHFCYNSHDYRVVRNSSQQLQNASRQPSETSFDQMSCSRQREHNGRTLHFHGGRKRSPIIYNLCTKPQK